jgi:amphi-Trp domain-containing protein
MDLLEIESRETLRREEVAERLHALADALARHNDVEFDRGGMHFKLKVPDEVGVKTELEVEDDRTELEIELTW